MKIDNPEATVARDLVRRAFLILPLGVLAVGIWRGLDGAASVALAGAVVSINFLLAATFITWGARISPSVLMSAVLGGFLFRMTLVLVVFAIASNVSWIDMPVFAITVICSHLGLLFWESRAVSLTLAYPGLKPHKAKRWV